MKSGHLKFMVVTGNGFPEQGFMVAICISKMVNFASEMIDFVLTRMN